MTGTIAADVHKSVPSDASYAKHLADLWASLQGYHALDCFAVFLHLSQKIQDKIPVALYGSEWSVRESSF